MTGDVKTRDARRRGATILSGLGLATMMVSPAAAQSITPANVDGFGHFVDCFGAMINNPDAHAQSCLPSQVGPQKDTLSSQSTPTVPVVPTVEEPVE